MVNISFSNLESYLGGISANTVDTPAEINITDTTVDDWIASINEGSVGYILTHAQRYVDLSSTTLPEDLEEMDSTFENCKYLVKAPSIPENINNLSECFRGCSNLQSAPTIPENVGSMFGTFQDCTSLTTAPTIPDTVSSLAYCFSGCTKLTSVSSIPDSVINMSYCFRNCTVLVTAPTLGNSILQMNGCFQGCTALVTGPKIPESVNNMTNCYNGCTSLTTINNFPNNITKTTKNTYKNCSSLYNGGIFRNITKVSELYNGAAIQACGMLVNSVTSTTFGDITDLKIYTTKEYYSSLKSSVETNYSDRNFSVIQVDACLDYDEISDWLDNQEENTEDTPYTLFVGGGLTYNVLQGSANGHTSVTSSPFGKLFIDKNIFVNLQNLCLSKDTNTLKYTFAANNYNTNYTPKIVYFCEIPTQVEILNHTFLYNQYLKNFGINNLIPENVIQVSEAFFNCTNLNDIYIEHHLANENNTNISYRFPIIRDTIDTDKSTYKIYAKDYSYMYSFNQAMCDARRVILECDYSDLGKYLSWWSNVCEDVQLKINNLPASSIETTGTGSSNEVTTLSKILTGQYEKYDTEKNVFYSDGQKWNDNQRYNIILGYSTMDLRLTKLPENITSLRYAFHNSNISYSPEIPETVNNLYCTYLLTPLKEAPKLPSTITSLNQTFSRTFLKSISDIPDTVTEMIGTFAYSSKFTTIDKFPKNLIDLQGCFISTALDKVPDIPDTVTDMSETFKYCVFSSIPHISNNVTDLYYCFEWCEQLTDIPNIPSTVVNLEGTFSECVELKTIHGWDLDVTKDNLTMTKCFNQCTNLTKIYTTSAPATKEYPSSDLDSGWRHITIKPTSYATYKITCRDLKGNTTKDEVTASDIQTFYTDEILFSPNGTLDDSYIEDMLSYKLAFGDGLDPSKKNFVVWAKDATAVKTNIVSNITNNVAELQETINELKSELGKSIKVVGRLADDTTSLTIENENITEDMMVSVFTSTFGISPSSISVVNGSVTVNFDEPHNGMTVGIKLEYFDATTIDYSIKYINTVANTVLTTIEPKTFRVTDNITLTIPNLSRTGYTLSGWTEDTSTNTLISGWSAGTKKDSVTLYTVWKANTYKVILNSNNDNNETVEVEAIFDTDITLPDNTFTSTDENAPNFLGWGLSSDSEEITYENGATVSNLTNVAEGTVNLYAIWGEGTITYHTNGGSYKN